MRRLFNKDSIWSTKEDEYARSLRKKEVERVVVTPDAILAPGERYGKATLRMPRVRSEFDLSRVEKTEDGISLVFERGFSIFEFADLSDFVKDRNLLHFAFGGGMLDIIIVEVEEEEEDEK